MKRHLGTLLCLIFLVSGEVSEAGSPCPSWKSVYPCFCSNLADGGSLVICPGIKTTSELEQVTKPLKSLIVDRLLLLNTFSSNQEDNSSLNALDTIVKIPTGYILPKKWLAELRVRELEIQNGDIDGCFLCDEALEGQRDFLTTLVVKNANLKGHLCSTCGLGSSVISVSTKELKRTPLLKYVDFSHNNIEFVDGYAFPANMTELTKIILSNNHISRIYENAFSNLLKLSHLDLSRNRLTSISRKILRSRDISLNTIDLSYNSIQTLPENMFDQMLGLKEVKLSHNLLETLPFNTWSKVPALLERMDLRGNFLVCNCTLNWITSRLSKSTKLVGQCVAPKEAEFEDLKPTLSTIARPCK